VSRSKASDVLDRRIRRGVLVVVLLSSVAGLATMLYGARLTPIQAQPRDSYGAGPLGHRAFAEILEALDMHVLQSRGDRYDGPSAPLFFTEPATEARVRGHLRKLEDAVALRAEADQVTIVVLPKWDIAPGGALRPTATAENLEAVEDILFAALPEDTLSGTELVAMDTRDDGYHELGGLLGEYVVELPRLQTITAVPEGATVLLDGAHGAVVLQHGSTYVVSDPDLLHNYNVHRAEHAALWVALFERIDTDTVVFDETFHGHGETYSLKRALGQFPPVLIVAHALLLVFLVVMAGMRRFGPASAAPPAEHGPREGIEVAASVLANGQQLGRLAGRYVASTLEDLHRRLGLPDASSLDARVARIDALAEQRGLPEDTAKRLLAKARQLSATNSGEVWAIARAAHRFRDQMLEQRTER